MRSWAWRVFNGVMYGNADYHRFGFRDTPKCTYCDEPKQNKYHLHYECPAAAQFWNQLSQTVTGTIDEKIIWTGSDDKGITMIVLTAHKYINSQNFAGKDLRIEGFLGWLREIRNVEKSLARRKDIFIRHLIKWEEIDNLINLDN